MEGWQLYMSNLNIKDKNKSIKKFIITIDVEGDNLWGKPKEIKTENSKFIYRFQRLCEKFGFKPTYLTNYEMANCKFFKEFGLELIKTNKAEVGMHLHAWNSPPIEPLTDNDFFYQPYLIEYRLHLIKEKVKIMTCTLEDIFQVKMVSHRAGRWAFNDQYAKVLSEYGYMVDCSVTPYVNWNSSLGNPSGKGGANYEQFSDKPYFLDLDNIRLSGKSNLLEVPMTVVKVDRVSNEIYKYCRNIVPSKYLRVFSPKILWLRPNGKNINNLLRIVDISVKNNCDYIEFMLHSSELMPGGSPTFSNDQSIEKLYNDLEILFNRISKDFMGVTLKEYYDLYAER